MSQDPFTSQFIAAADAIGNSIIETLGGWLDNLTAAVKDKCGEFMSACGQRMGELKTSIGQGLSNLRPSNISTPMAKPDVAPAVAMSPEISAPAFSPAPSVQNAISGMNFSCMAEDLGDVSVGDSGVGCAAQTFSRFQTNSYARAM